MLIYCPSRMVDIDALVDLLEQKFQFNSVSVR